MTRYQHTIRIFRKLTCRDSALRISITSIAMDGKSWLLMMMLMNGLLLWQYEAVSPTYWKAIPTGRHFPYKLKLLPQPAPELHSPSYWYKILPPPPATGIWAQSQAGTNWYLWLPVRVSHPGKFNRTWVWLCHSPQKKIYQHFNFVISWSAYMCSNELQDSTLILFLIYFLFHLWFYLGIEFSIIPPFAYV